MKIIGNIFGGAILIGLGFLLRGLLPAGGPPPGPMGMGEMPPPAVVAVELSDRPLDVRDEYIAMIEPVQSVDVRTEVSGYIDGVHFREGAWVKEGDLLFTIDQRQYQALVEVRDAELARAQADLTNAERFLERMRNAGERSISESDLDNAESAQLQAVASLKQAEANLNLAKIDLEYAEIRSPISGRIGAARMTKGNYVDTSSDALARIVQLDPIRIVFSMTDRAYLNLRERELKGEANGLAAQVELPNGAMLPMVGAKDFDDNEMNAKTGTLAVRYLFDNPNGLLVPSGYVNLLLGQRERPVGIRVSQTAIMVDPDGTYVLTVDEQGVVTPTHVKLGNTIEQDMVVLEGLNVGDRVIVDGVQKVRPGMTAAVTLLEVGK